RYCVVTQWEHYQPCRLVQCHHSLRWTLCNRCFSSRAQKKRIKIRSSLRWYYDRNNGGFPASLYEAVELDDLLENFPQKVLDMGTVVGGLSKKAAEELGLPPGIPVAEGGADSMVGTVGMDVLAPGKIALITGSSHAIFGVS